MSRHYGSEDLLAHAYLPDEDAELALHLAGCDACGAHYRALRDGLELHAREGAGADRPETFWKRQELSVMRAVENRRRPMVGTGVRFAAAAAVLLVVGAFWAGRGSVTIAPVTSTMATSTIASVAGVQDNGLAASQLNTDPWQSEQLQDFQSVVAWESWVSEEQKTDRGTI